MQDQIQREDQQRMAEIIACQENAMMQAASAYTATVYDQQFCN